MNPTDVNSSKYIAFDVQNNAKYPKNLSWWSCEDIKIWQNLCQRSIQIGQNFSFCYQKENKCVPWTYIIEDLNGEEKSCKRQSKHILGERR